VRILAPCGAWWFAAVAHRRGERNGILLLEDGGLRPAYFVVYLLGACFAVTFWYSWMCNHTGGSVLITLVSHATQGGPSR